MSFQSGFNQLIEGRIAATHVHAERQAGAGELVPNRRETVMRQQPLAGGTEDHRCAGAELVHFTLRFNGFIGIAQGQKPRPFQTL